MNQFEYNCGGFALDTNNWYRPYPKKYAYPGGLEELIEDMGIEMATDYMVKYMLKEFDGRLRVVQNPNEVKFGEKLVLFRLGYDGFDADFHYIVKDNGSFWHKMGQSYIEKLLKKEVFSENWFGFYDGPIVYFAKKVE